MDLWKVLEHLLTVVEAKQLDVDQLVSAVGFGQIGWSLYDCLSCKRQLLEYLYDLFDQDYKTQIQAVLEGLCFKSASFPEEFLCVDLERFSDLFDNKSDIEYFYRESNWGQVVDSEYSDLELLAPFLVKGALDYHPTSLEDFHKAFCLFVEAQIIDMMEHLQSHIGEKDSNSG